MIRRIVVIACAASLAIGLSFIFVWAPHPWGWEGFDNYHSFGLTLARGEPFPTVDQPWGYAYFLAAFYRVFGDRPVVPLVVQAAINALLPLLVFVVGRIDFDERVAAVAALLTGCFCFNTVYASTQSADAICTVIFMAGVALVVHARQRGDLRAAYGLAGLLFGVAPQFRPNLILVPALIAVVLVVQRRTLARLRGALVVIAASAVVLLPWVVHNERLTGELLPTSTHGGVQLWYGTLQTGPYLASRAYNPRSVFETPSFPYTSLDRVPLIVTGRRADCATGTAPSLVYWTDRDTKRRHVRVDVAGDGTVRAEMPPAPAPTAYYFYMDGLTRSGPPAPSVYFISDDHLGDMDRHGDLLDVFDLVRLVRHVTWDDPVPNAGRLDFDGDGRLTDADISRAADALLAHAASRFRHPSSARVERRRESATLWFGDGSTLTVPRAWSGRVTDLEVRGDLAAAVLTTSVPFGQLQADAPCNPVEDLAVNAVYYRADPHAMRRYVALAFDNSRRDPLAYAKSVGFRAIRVFFIEGSGDLHTAFQFSGSGRIYRAARIVSIAFLVLFGAGVVAARRRGAAIALPLVLIAYIPATLAFVLTNMRYSITVQPLMFIFVAALFVSVYERAAAAPRRADTGTVRQP